MLTTLLLNGGLLIGFLVIFSRWLDDEIIADCGLWAVFTEFCFGVASVKYLESTDAMVFLHFGSLSDLPGGCEHLLLFLFDELSAYFLAILSFALLLCFFFLTEYFEYDANASSIIVLSAGFSQLALVYFATADLYSLLFLWEAISLVSFLLVQHWSHRVASFKAGLKVFAVSQFGDLPFFAFVFGSLARFSSTDVNELLLQVDLLQFEYLCFGPLFINLADLLALSLQTAALLKAAQWFFYPWLLDAMEAPVPISAQLHSSTLVVIGFYLLFRFQALFSCSALASNVSLAAGFFTSVGASVLGFFQLDGKKLLACSTASQLGYVQMAWGLGLVNEASLLLLFCCCNKAMAFVLFGTLMRRYSGVSDFRMLAGVGGVSWLEHALLFSILCNFTVAPGLFCWHTKGLFMSDALQPMLGGLALLALTALQLTWFLSSLYLWYLYMIVFLYSCRNASLPTSGRLYQIGVSSVLSYAQSLSTFFFGWLTLSLAALLLAWPIQNLFLQGLDWAMPELSGQLSYF